MRKKKILRVLSVLFSLSALGGYVACSQRLHNPTPLSAGAPAIVNAPVTTQPRFGGWDLMPPFPASNVVAISAAEQEQIMASSSKSGVLAPDVEKLILSQSTADGHSIPNRILLSNLSDPIRSSNLNAIWGQNGHPTVRRSNNSVGITKAPPGTPAKP